MAQVSTNSSDGATGDDGYPESSRWWDGTSELRLPTPSPWEGRKSTAHGRRGGTFPRGETGWARVQRCTCAWWVLEVTKRWVGLELGRIRVEKPPPGGQVDATRMGHRVSRRR